jgi:hypothetical protein
MSRISFGMIEAGYIPGDLGAFKKEAGKIKLYGDSAPAQPTDITQRSVTFPEQLQPYVEETLGKAKALTEQPYQTYTGQRQAKFDPMQLQAQQAAANLGPAQQLGTATQMAGLAGLAAGNLKYSPTSFSNQFVAPPAYQNTQFTYEKVKPSTQAGGTMAGAQTGYDPSLTNYQMGPVSDVTTQSFATPDAATSYMSPYMQSVVDIQQREAQRAADIAGTQRSAQAVGSGAFGGSRQAIMEAEAARNLAQQKGDIQAQGSQAAFQQAQQQFNAEQAARLQAQQANQQAGLTIGQQNLAANLGVQQLGKGQIGLQTALANLSNTQQANVQNLAAKLQTQGLNAQQALQAALANQQMNMTAQQATEQSKQYGYGQSMTAAQQAAQYGLAAQQAQEQSKQFGSNLGLQGIQARLSAAGTLGQLGQTQFGQQKDIINAQAAAGAQRQAAQQQLYDTKYQDFLRQQQYPYQQLSYMAEMERGTPLSNFSQSMYAAPPSVGAQLAGLGTAAYGASRYFAGGGLTALALHNMTK